MDSLRRELDRVNQEIAAIESAERRATIRRVQSLVREAQELISEHGLTAQELKLKFYKKAVVKYRDSSGNTWDGFGPPPSWVRDAVQSGKPLSAFAV